MHVLFLLSSQITYAQNCQLNPPINIALTGNNLACNDDSSGCVHAVVTGGSGNPMNLTWSNGLVNVDSICNLPSDQYTLVVTDTFVGGATGLIYSENFDGTHNWTLNVPTDTNSSVPNTWVVNDSEGGVAPPNCNTGSNGNKTLHIVCTSLFCGSLITGAIYNASEISNTRAESPVFSTIGNSNISLEFNYIANGDGLLDNASIWYNIGSGWVLLAPSIKSPLCGGGGGLWSKFNMVLPAVCENQASVQIGINWENNADNIGSDASVAIDSFEVTASTSVLTTLTCVDSQSIFISNPFASNLTISCDSSSLNSISFSWQTLGSLPNGFYEYSIDNGTTWVNVGNASTATVNNLDYYTSYNVWIRANDGLGCAGSISTSTCTTLVPDCNDLDSIVIDLRAYGPYVFGDSSGCIHALISGGSGNPPQFTWSNGITNIDSICMLPAGTYSVTVTDTFSINSPFHTSIYEENFDGVHNWTLNIPTDTNAITPNIWTVNDTEGGVAPPGCGTGLNGNQTLHITCTSLFCATLITGAHYNASEISNTRAESPVFSTIGSNSSTLEFNYIANGDGLLDNASIWYNIGNGWTLLIASIKSPLCGAQGLWTKFSTALPASCENQDSVQIGINWENNGDNIGTDPSVAIDSFKILGGLNTNITCMDSATIILSEPSFLIATTDSIVHPSSTTTADGMIFLIINGGIPPYTFLWSNGSTTVNLTGLSQGTYSVTVTDSAGATLVLQYTLSPPNSVINLNSKSDWELVLYPIPAKNILFLQSNMLLDDSIISIYNTLGQLVYNQKIKAPTLTTSINIESLNQGHYYLKIKNNQKLISKHFLIN